ncbi:MAG: ANTAR domain-containing protein [Verrucomicrobiales bacterium]|nr:ANTAR domain-containing protein [Verrucomicrobiales bacterium]
MKETKYRVALAHGKEETRSRLQIDLEELGHSILFSSDSCKETISRTLKDEPDLIVSGILFDDGDGIDALIEIAETRCLPAIVVTSISSLKRVEDAMDDHVMAYLIEPVRAVDLKPAIHVVLRRFEQFEDLHQEVSDLKLRLATRKKVERAKGILMVTKGISEEEAYLQLRAAATRNRVTMGKVSDLIIDTATGS